MENLKDSLKILKALSDKMANARWFVVWAYGQRCGDDWTSSLFGVAAHDLQGVQLRVELAGDAV